MGHSGIKISETSCFVEEVVFIKRREIDVNKERFIEPTNLLQVFIL